MANESNEGFKLPRLSLVQLINLCVGIIGIQFAWSMQIALSSRVLEPLGADPFIFGLIWCAGPITGLLIQPIVGALSDRTWTKIGRRRPFLLFGGILGGIALIFFPIAPTLLIAAIMIWIIDACVNISQGPYRALIPDITPPEQHAVANSYLNFAFGAGSVIALGAAIVLRNFDIQMSITNQYFMASAALILTIIYTTLTIKEYARPKEVMEQKKKESLLDSYKKFLKCSPEIHKICGVQFLTWLGIMCMFIYLTPYTVHFIYKVPDMSSGVYKVQEEMHKGFTEVQDATKKDSKNLIASNLIVSDVIQKMKPDKLNYNDIKDYDFRNEKSAKQIASNINADTKKYQELNDKLDVIMPGILKNYSNAEINDIKKLVTTDVKDNKYVKKLENEDVKLSKKLDKLETIKSLADCKVLLAQYYLLSNEAIAKKVVVKTENKTEVKEIKKLEKENTAINSTVKGMIKYKDPKDFILSDSSKIKEIETLPGTMIKFLNINKITQFKRLDLEATYTAQMGLVAFNFVALILSIPIGYLCNVFGKKGLYSITLGFLAVGFAFAPFLTDATGVIIMMTFAGVAWATILSIPFAFLCDYMPKGEEGSLMGIFNMFIAGPQLISATIVSYVILSSPLKTQLGMAHNWSIAFIVASVSVIGAIILLQSVKEKRHGIGNVSIAGGGH